MRSASEVVVNVALVALLCSVAGCNSAASPDNITAAVSMGQASGSVRAFTSTTNGRTVTVLGGISMSNGCYSASASVEAKGKVIEATVKAVTATGVFCTGMIDTRDYTLTLAGMPVGSWTLRVLHKVDASAAVQVYETALTVSK